MDEQLQCFGTGGLLLAVHVLASQLLKALTRSRQLEVAYWGERRGRTRVEREVRQTIARDI